MAVRFEARFRMNCSLKAPIPLLPRRVAVSPLCAWSRRCTAGAILYAALATLSLQPACAQASEGGLRQRPLGGFQVAAAPQPSQQGSPPKAHAKDVTAYLPADATLVVAVRPREILSNVLLKDIMTFVVPGWDKVTKTLQQDLGLPLHEIEIIVLAKQADTHLIVVSVLESAARSASRVPAPRGLFRAQPTPTVILLSPKQSTIDAAIAGAMAPVTYTDLPPGDLIVQSSSIPKLIGEMAARMDTATRAVLQNRDLQAWVLRLRSFSLALSMRGRLKLLNFDAKMTDDESANEAVTKLRQLFVALDTAQKAVPQGNPIPVRLGPDLSAASAARSGEWSRAGAHIMYRAVLDVLPSREDVAQDRSPLRSRHAYRKALDGVWWEEGFTVYNITRLPRFQQFQRREGNEGFLEWLTSFPKLNLGTNATLHLRVSRPVPIEALALHLGAEDRRETRDFVEDNELILDTSGKTPGPQAVPITWYHFGWLQAGTVSGQVQLVGVRFRDLQDWEKTQRMSGKGMPTKLFAVKGEDKVPAVLREFRLPVGEPYHVIHAQCSSVRGRDLELILRCEGSTEGNQPPATDAAAIYFTTRHANLGGRGRDAVRPNDLFGNTLEMLRQDEPLGFLNLDRRGSVTAGVVSFDVEVQQQNEFRVRGRLPVPVGTLDPAGVSIVFLRKSLQVWQPISAGFWVPFDSTGSRTADNRTGKGPTVPRT